LSIRDQCRLTGVSRSGYYYEPEPETDENLELMRLLDEQYLRTPFWGVENMTWWLGQQGWQVNPKRVRRLLRVMGLEAIYAKPRLSVPAPGHRIYPYLLRDVVIDRPDHCWCSDITYIRLRGGFVYLVAIMELVQPIRAQLGGIGVDGDVVLHVSAGLGTEAGTTGNLQYRSGRAVQYTRSAISYR
jgi:putative transposase